MRLLGATKLGAEAEVVRLEAAEAGQDAVESRELNRGRFLEGLAGEGASGRRKLPGYLDELREWRFDPGAGRPPSGNPHTDSKYSANGIPAASAICMASASKPALE